MPVATREGLIGGMAMHVVTSYSTPSITSIRKLCKRPPPSRRPTCIAVLAHMASGSEMIDQVIGLHLGIPLVADTAESVAWRERLRRLIWLHQRFPGQRGQPLPPDWFARMFERGEMPALESWLAERGLRTDPPPGWLPDNPRQRALILAGRPPTPASR